MSKEQKKIEMGKQYRNGRGRSVRILCIDRKGTIDEKYPVVGLVNQGNVREELATYTATGYNYFGSEGSDKEEDDLVEVGRYDDFKIDDKVLVWNGDNPRAKRYFAGVNKDGQALAFAGGATSFSCTFSCTSDNINPSTTSWDNCIKFEQGA